MYYKLSKYVHVYVIIFGKIWTIKLNMSKYVHIYVNVFCKIWIINQI